MKFCPNCGSMMIPKEEKKKRLLLCSCGHTEDTKEAIITETNKKDTLSIAIIEKEEKDTNPLADEECPKCKHTRAYTWEVQTRAADEPATRFFKCEKCKHTWREY